MEVHTVNIADEKAVKDLNFFFFYIAPVPDAKLLSNVSGWPVPPSSHVSPISSGFSGSCPPGLEH